MSSAKVKRSSPFYAKKKKTGMKQHHGKRCARETDSKSLVEKEVKNVVASFLC
jgi:hypothetical protein